MNEIDVILAAHRREEAIGRIVTLVIAVPVTAIVFGVIWVVGKVCG